MTTADVTLLSLDRRLPFPPLPASSRWFFALGVGLVILGMIALSSAAMASVATTLVIGFLLLIGGFGELIGVFWCRGWTGFFHHLLSGVLSIVVGALVVRAPVDTALGITLLLAILFLVGGIFRIITVASHRFTAWGWPLASGVIDLILGVMIWREWPGSALWVIGTFVGISLIFRGFNWIGLYVSIRGTLRRQAELSTP